MIVLPRHLSRRFSWLPLAVTAGLLVLVLAFLYSRTRAYDAASYFEDVALLRQIQQVDARWELDALRAKVGINSNYDSLVEHQTELRRLRERLAATVAGRRHEDRLSLDAAIAAFGRALEEKSGLVEDFKSRNSVLHNSLAFLPTAAADIGQAAASGAGRAPSSVLRPTLEQVSHVLVLTLVYSQAASVDRAVEIETEIERLAPAWEALPPAAGERLGIFVQHVHTILREQQMSAELLGRIAAVPVAPFIEAIGGLLGQEQQRAAARVQRYRLYLAVFSGALIALLVYAALGLIRSHAVINRVNRELQESNSRLEERVEERTRQLRAAQEELVATARRAGMAEIATNVLHNVGNVLNSVNVCAGVVIGQVRASKAQGISRVVRMLDEHAGDFGDFLAHDPKGRLLPDYLAKLAAALAAEQEGMLEELGQLTRSIDHIRDIVATQQSYAGASRLLEAVRVQDLVEDALRMNAGALTRHEVTVVREFAAVPVLALDRHRILQILINLISNAKYAMDGVDGLSRRMTLGIDLVDGGEGQRLRLRVADEGEGIPAENLARIFGHGFTTRRNGHGFGLHSAALAAREMGGTLAAASEGPGRGAVFTLELPLAAGC